MAFRVPSDRFDLIKGPMDEGYCCGHKYIFSPQILCCSSKQLCTIPRDAKYYSYENRYPYCQKCFSEIPGDTVNLGDEPTAAQASIKKDQFIEMKNDHLELEPFVECQECGRKLHQICALHLDCIWPQGFTCDNCLKAKNTKRKDNKFTAKSLPTTKVGTYIETRVNNFLKKKESGAGEVCIRVVSSSEKIVEVKAGMKGRFVEIGELCATFPYKAKALFAFEEIDGTDVCFFGMHVQEYGSECPTPNTRRVYISYLDSVHFFRPRQFRTAVYHEILLGYLEYVKQLGYTMAHIWASPPTEGDEYIFHCHPPEQKIPKAKRLQEWYKKMLDKGIIERIVLDYKNILKQAMEDNLVSPAELPYFEGDFWPNVLEESIKELDQEEEKKRRQAGATPAAGADGKKKAKKSNKSKANQRKNNKKSYVPQTGNALSNKIFATMDKHKELFFVIRLHSAQSAASLGPIQDPDLFIQCDLMDGRDAFLAMARDKHYEFSSLRRAKYSSMIMLYELHDQGQDRFVYTCNICKNHVETRYHCAACDDFDLCVGCYQKVGHPHEMHKLGLELDDGSSSSQENKSTNPQEIRKLSIQRCIQSLVHACQCRDVNCRLPACQKMKRVVAHAKACKRKTNGVCPICKQLIALCCLHAKHCVETKCTVQFCATIKHKLKQQQAHQRLQQDQLLRRRMQMMQMMGGGGSTAPSTSTPPVSTPARPALVVPQAMGSPMTLGMWSIGEGKPGSGAPLAALQAARQVQEEVARQHAQTIAPTGLPVIPSPQPNHQPAPHQHMMPSSRNQVGFRGPTPHQRPPNAPIGQGQVRHPGLSGMDQMQNKYPGMPPARPMNNAMQPQQTNMMMQGQPGPQNSPEQNQAQPQHGMGRVNQQIRPVEAEQGQVTPSGQVLLHHLLKTLESPPTFEQQQQVFQILKSNKELMTAFTMHRQQEHQQLQEKNVQQGQASQPTPPVMNPQQQQPQHNFIQRPGMGNVAMPHHSQLQQQRPQMMSLQQQNKNWIYQQQQIIMNKQRQQDIRQQFLNYSKANQLAIARAQISKMQPHIGNLNTTISHNQMGGIVGDKHQSTQSQLQPQTSSMMGIGNNVVNATESPQCRSTSLFLNMGQSSFLGPNVFSNTTNTPSSRLHPTLQVPFFVCGSTPQQFASDILVSRRRNGHQNMRNSSDDTVHSATDSSNLT